MAVSCTKAHDWMAHSNIHADFKGTHMTSIRLGVQDDPASLTAPGTRQAAYLAFLDNIKYAGEIVWP